MRARAVLADACPSLFPIHSENYRHNTRRVRPWSSNCTDRTLRVNFQTNSEYRVQSEDDQSRSVDGKELPTVSSQIVLPLPPEFGFTILNAFLGRIREVSFGYVPLKIGALLVRPRQRAEETRRWLSERRFGLRPGGSRR